ncbi:MAG: hypothetical protein IT373_15900 [Polyangiaceae bacterium]|nr:hypothetical protein [Polyangiaceae bacterium]
MNTSERVALLEKLLDRVKSRPPRRKADAGSDRLITASELEAKHPEHARAPERVEPPASDAKATLISNTETSAAARAARALEPVRVIAADEIPPAEPSAEASVAALAAAGFFEGRGDLAAKVLAPVPAPSVEAKPAAVPVEPAATAVPTPEARAAEPKSAFELLAEVKAAKSRAPAPPVKPAVDAGARPAPTEPAVPKPALALDEEPARADEATRRPEAARPAEVAKPVEPVPAPAPQVAAEPLRRPAPPPLPRAEEEGRRSAPPPLPVSPRPAAAVAAPRAEEALDEGDEPTAIHSRKELAALQTLLAKGPKPIEDEITSEAPIEAPKLAPVPSPAAPPVLLAPREAPTPVVAPPTPVVAPPTPVAAPPAPVVAPVAREAAPAPLAAAAPAVAPAAAKRVAELVAEPPPAPAPALSARPELVTVRPELIKPVIVATGRVGEFIGEVEQPPPPRFGDLLDATLDLGFD